MNGKIVIAPDSFKECLSAPEVAATMARAVRKALPEAEVIEMPLADGGEGTMEILTRTLGGIFHEAVVRDPLGRPVNVRFGTVGDTGILDVAGACGLSRLAPEERDPLRASSRGVGELILAACREGCRHLLIGLGGSATCDGGTGMLSVPGIRQVLSDCSVDLLCDVDNPFIGPDGAARVFAPQKGASPEDVDILERRMEETARIFAQETHRDVSRIPGAGAAGGLGGALLAYADAHVFSGIDRVMDILGFDRAVRNADLVITGEGHSDTQTLHGKVPFGVLRRARTRVLLVSGAIDPEAVPLLTDAGFAAIRAVTPPGVPLREALKPETAQKHLAEALAHLGNLGYLCSDL